MASLPWPPEAEPDKQPFATSIEPSEVLYDFDGPLLFVSSGNGPFPLLCYKTREDGRLSQFILAPTNSEIVAKLKTGKLALRSAITPPWLWAAEVDDAYQVGRTWFLTPASVPSDVLPEPNLGMYYEHGIVNERIAAIESPFLSLYFKGGEVSAGTLTFSVFKMLLDQIYNSVWDIFSPALQAAAPEVKERTIRKAFSVPIHEPAFGSLFVAIERPKLDFADFNIEKRPVVDFGQAQKNIESANRSFLESIDTVAIAAQKGRLTKKFVQDHHDAIEAISDLVPGENSSFESLEIQGIRGNSGALPSVIRTESGQRIREAYRLSILSGRTIRGRIVETSDRSFSFIVRTGQFREVTCKATTQPVRSIFPDLRNGMKVTVTGRFQKRKRRDQIIIEYLKFGTRVVQG